MSRIEKKFQELKGKSAFIGYITAGDPTIEKTKELVIAMEKGGCDIVELGIPYSDPVADGPVIQAAAQRALDNGTTVDKIFEEVEKIREDSQIPLVFLVYYNTIYSIGVENFVKECSKNGVDGLIVPDLPVEEREEILPYIKKYNVDLIPLVAPNSEERIPKIIENGGGFVYCISSFGVTGTREEFDSSIGNYLEKVRKSSHLPLAVGFGISTREDVETFEKLADGVIVGSALVKVVEKNNGDSVELQKKVKELCGK